MAAFSTARQAVQGLYSPLIHLCKATADLLQLSACLPLPPFNSPRFSLKSNLRHCILQGLKSLLKNQKPRLNRGLQHSWDRHFLIMCVSVTAPAAFSGSRTEEFRCAVNCSSLPGVTWDCLQFVPVQTECGHHHCHTPQPVHLADFHQAACDQLSSTAFEPAKTTTEHPCGCHLRSTQLQADYKRQSPAYFSSSHLNLAEQQN